MLKMAGAGTRVGWLAGCLTFILLKVARGSRESLTAAS